MTVLVSLTRVAMRPSCPIVLGLLGLVCLMCLGCSATSSSQYRPLEVPQHLQAWDRSTRVDQIVDLRSPELSPDEFYRHYQDVAQYDRPVADIVREAVETELARAGLLQGSSQVDFYLNCEILKYQAIVTEHETDPTELDLKVSIRFTWLNPESREILAQSVRVLNRHRVLGADDVVALPFDLEQVRGFGAELLNDMLPRLVQEELTLNAWLVAQGRGQTSSSREVH